MRFIRWVKSLFTPTPAPQPSPKPPRTIPDELSDEHDRDFNDPKKPDVSTWTPEYYRQEYVELWHSTKYPVLRSGSNGKQQASTITWTINRIRANEDRYKKCSEYVFQKSGKRYPWELIAALHMREAGGDFKKNFLNGQPLNMRTTWVPKGRGPFATWEDSVVDGFGLKKFPDKWNIANTLHYCHLYNGLGYMTETRRKISGHSPYLFAFTQHYKQGYFVSDGKFSSSAIALGVGVVVILKELGFKGGVMQEEWRDVVGFEGYYQVSNLGKVRSVDRVIANSSTGSGSQKVKGQEMSQANGGYKRTYRVVNLKKFNSQKMALVHRLVAEAFIPNHRDATEVNHKDGNKDNNHVSNLEWSSPMENSRHYASNHKIVQGYKIHKHKNGKISYHCRFRACGTDVSLGYYPTKEECQKIYVDTYKEFYGVEPKIAC